MKTVFWTALTGACMLAAGCGDDTKEVATCGPGTYGEPGNCQVGDQESPVSTATPAGGRFFELPAVVLGANEPATIYYTTDGTAPTTGSDSGASPLVVQPVDGVEVQFFAVDASGNTETVNTHTYVYDIEAPHAVSNMAAAVTDGDANVTWTNPDVGDFSGVLLVRTVAMPVAGGPVNGTTYSVGQSLAGGHAVLYAGTAESFADAGLIPGQTSYAAWAFDSAGNYSPLRTATALVTLPPQTATLTVDVAAGTVTVNNPPPNTGLSGTAAFDTGTLTVSLTIENQATRILFNPKVIIDAITGTTGTFANGDGFLSFKPFRTYGPLGLSPGAQRAADLVFDSVGDTDVVNIDIEIGNAPLLLSNDYYNDNEEHFVMFDMSTKLRTATVSAPLAQLGAAGLNFRYTWGHMTPDATTMFVGSRHRPVLASIDLAGMNATKTLALNKASSNGYLGNIRANLAGDTLYALVVDGSRHRLESAIDDIEIGVVRVDAATLLETGRVVTANPSGQGTYRRTQWMDMNPDRTLAAYTIHDKDDYTSSMHMVAVDTMTEIDLDPNQDGIQGLDLTTTLHAGQITFSPDGSTIYIGGSDQMDTILVKVDVATNAVTPIDTGAPLGSSVKSFAWTKSGALHMAVRTGTDSGGIYTLDNGSVTQIPGLDMPVRGMRILPNGKLLVSRVGSYGPDESRYLYEIDPATGSVDRRILGCDPGDRFSSMAAHYFPLTPF